MAELVFELVGSGKTPTVGLERLNANAAIALRDHGLNIVDAQRPVEMARAIKSAEEVKCVVSSLRATEVAVGKLRDAVRPGLTENELWLVRLSYYGAFLLLVGHDVIIEATSLT